MSRGGITLAVGHYFRPVDFSRNFLSYMFWFFRFSLFPTYVFLYVYELFTKPAVSLGIYEKPAVFHFLYSSFFMLKY